MRRALFLAALGAACAAGPALAEVDLPEAFDPMGPAVETMTVSDGRMVAYVDTGPEDGAPVLFIGGTGTSAAAVGLTDFLRTMREDLGLRLISVGRAGFGQTDPAEDWGFEDFAEDATQVLDALGVGEVAVLAISGGGPYSAAFAAKEPGRIRSIHLAAATALAEPSGLCAMDPEERAEVLNDYAAHPLRVVGLPRGQPHPRHPRLRHGGGRRRRAHLLHRRAEGRRGGRDRRGRALLHAAPSGRLRRRGAGPHLPGPEGHDRPARPRRALGRNLSQRRARAPLPGRGPRRAVSPLGPDPGGHGRHGGPPRRLPRRHLGASARGRGGGGDRGGREPRGLRLAGVSLRGRTVERSRRP